MISYIHVSYQSPFAIPLYHALSEFNSYSLFVFVWPYLKANGSHNVSVNSSMLDIKLLTQSVGNRPIENAHQLAFQTLH